ncbi:RNA:NAD 2'-phosphotransferase [hydrothermal vent metagenome]|uniref:RNA:NAD 2'-phosphotransferase n=1 Tax=hydrothermal vent metagenome TaxID=652676 RepID=A0A3B0Y3S9_9ZZZZ
MERKTVNASKFMSLLLRHQPEAIGLELDECGWANIETLISLSGQHKNKLNIELIKEVVRTNDKQRFSISEDGRFVRANQGHSIKVDLNLEPQQPRGFISRYSYAFYSQYI